MGCSFVELATRKNAKLLASNERNDNLSRRLLTEEGMIRPKQRECPHKEKSSNYETPKSEHIWQGKELVASSPAYEKMVPQV